MSIFYNGAARRFRGWLVLLFTAFTTVAAAQQPEISGIVRDEKGEPVTGATVIAYEGGVVKGGAATGIDGDFSIKPLTPGTYDVHVTFLGYVTIILERVEVSSSGATVLDNLVLREPKASSSGGSGGGIVIGETVVRSTFVKPLIRRGTGGGITDFNAKDFERAATRNPLDVVSRATGTYQARNGAGISMGGGRQENTLVIIDGILQRGQGIASRLPFGSIGSMAVISGGLPAKYGDATGGVISITTKGVTAKVQGSVGAEHSVDGYNNRQAYFNVTGPLVKRPALDDSGNIIRLDSLGLRVREGGTIEMRPLVGFSISGTFANNQDNNPSYVPNYIVKEDVLRRLQENPYVAVPGITGVPTLRNATEFVTLNDLETTRRRVNAEATSASLLTKFDLAIGKNMNFTVGGQGFYSRGDNYSRGVALFSPEAIGQSTSYTGQGFARFVQRFRSTDTAATIQSAFYTVQVDYQKTYSYNQDNNHKRDAFKYGYIGKFYQDENELYVPGFDSSTGKAGILLQPGLRFSNTRFERSELNSLLANYTSQVFNLFGENINNFGVRDVRAFNGLLNGDLPAGTYGGIFSNVGSVQGGYGYSNSDQLSVGVDASVDLQAKGRSGNRMRHALEFGLYFQQQASRSYGVNALRGGTQSLWEQAYLLTNSHFFGTQDLSNPIFVVNGRRYTAEDVRNGVVNPGPNDTILYNTVYNEGQQTIFDRNLREKLGLGANNTDYINVYELDPSLLSVDMFAPDELFNSGRSYVSYLGYDYTGKRAGNSSFNDFFTAKDANGTLTRPVSAFRPNYVAGYISDNFTLSNSLMFNLGVRVDRYDANTSVLKDPYSLYETYTKGNNQSAVNFRNGGTDAANQGHPGNISEDAVVYVNDFGTANPEIVGYRDGDNFYDPFGRLVEDPTTLKQYTGGRDPLPYLVDKASDIQGPNFDPAKSFEDYTPQVNVMPRLSFAFNITRNSSFYAHYNVVVQRPSAGVALTPLDYYFLETNPTDIINNPNLRPEKQILYETGLEQVIAKATERSGGQAINLSAFYRERKDQIQIRPYLYAYPTTYYTFGNRDFSTTKGLRVKYDLRRTGPFELLLSYTLQFAEGTGSNLASSNGGNTTSFQTGGILSNFISAGLPNIRYPFALDIDSRHNLVADLDYRYFAYDSTYGGGGPRIGKLHPFQNMGAHLTFRTRSGEPYTRYANSVTNIVAGGVNGARLPWHYMFDLNIDKDFALFPRNSDGSAVKGKKQLYLNAFVYVQNLLDTRDVLGVYGYSSRPDDNGFLESPQGQQQVQQQTNVQSYTDLYRISVNGPGNFNVPRRVNMGVRFNF